MAKGIVGKVAPIAGTASRPFQCQSCRHWECGEGAVQHYVTRRNASLKKLPPLARLARQETNSKLRPGETDRFKVFDQMLRSGQLGICLIGKSETDFCHASYGRQTEQLPGCNHWEGRPDAGGHGG